MIPEENPARLSVSLTNGLNVEIRLGVKEIRIGRGRDADLLLPDPSVSRLHARIFRVGGQYFLADTSRNGTYLDGKRVTQAILEGGQAFRIGPYQIHFLHERQSAEPDPPTVAQGIRSGGAPAGPMSTTPSAPSSDTFGLVGKG